MQEELNSRLSKMEVTVEEHSKQLAKQQDKNELQVEMNTLLKMQIESNKKQNDQMVKFSNTLDKVNDNLTSLNSKQSMLDDRVTGIEDTLQDSNISTTDIFKGMLKYTLTTVGGVILAYILLKLKLN